jgi:hypothetical protein
MDIFQLNPADIKIPLSEISQITINPINPSTNMTLSGINTSNRGLIIMDVNFNFNPDIIPAITSLFEHPPHLYHQKNYITADNNIITIKKPFRFDRDYGDYGDKLRDISYQVLSQETSFWTDIDNGVYKYNHVDMEISKRKTVKSIIDQKTGFITRIYSNPGSCAKQYSSDKQYLKTDFSDILVEEETRRLKWIFNEWGVFELVIYPESGKCKYEFNIKVIEDNNLIKARIDHINKLLMIFSKIKSAFIIN